jgi:hypothetical protein
MGPRAHSELGPTASAFAEPTRHDRGNAIHGSLSVHFSGTLSGTFLEPTPCLHRLGCVRRVAFHGGYRRRSPRQGPYQNRSPPRERSSHSGGHGTHPLHCCTHSLDKGCRICYLREGALLCLGAFEGVLPSSGGHLTVGPPKKQEETQATPVILWEDFGTAVAGRGLTDSLGVKSIFNTD